MGTVEIDFTVLEGMRAALGESPVWCEREGCLWWVDIDGGRLVRSRPDAGEADVWPTPETPGFVVLTDQGAPAVGMQTGIFLFDGEAGRFERIVDLLEEGVRFNDAAVDATGRLWAGTMALDNGAPVGQLYAIGADRRLRPVLDRLWTVNGLAADADRGRLYVSDSHPSRQTIWSAALDLASGALGERSVFVDMTPRRGRPDGAALDRDGRYWIAGVDAGLLHVFDPEGGSVAEIETPFANPTKPCFGGGGAVGAGERLFLTSKGGEPPNGAVAEGRARLGALNGRESARWRIGG